MVFEEEFAGGEPQAQSDGWLGRPGQGAGDDVGLFGAQVWGADQG